MSSSHKLEEAQFFLELLDLLDDRNRPLTHVGEPAKEASFLFSAILNSFYSAIAIMRDVEGIEVSSFVADHPEIYAVARKGGERAKTVHVSHTPVAFSGLIPVPAVGHTTHLRRIPVLMREAQQPGRADCTLGPDHYMMIELSGKHVQVNDFCYSHYYALQKFHEASIGNLRGSA
jgi:hypothetical protein